MKNLLLLLPLFFTTITMGMDLGTICLNPLNPVPKKERHSPASLQYLAASQVPYNEFKKHKHSMPAQVHQYLENVISEQFDNKRIKEEAEFRISQEILLKQINPSYEMIQTHLNDGYSQNPHIFTDEFIKKLLAKSLDSGTSKAAEWIIDTFPESKTDEILYPHLQKSITDLGQGRPDKVSYNFCFNHISKSYLVAKSVDLLLASVHNNVPEITRHLLQEFSQINIANAFTVAVREGHATCLHALFQNADALCASQPKIVLELIKELLGWQHTGQNCYTLNDRIQKKDILKYLLSQPTIRTLCQDLLVDKATHMLFNIERYNEAASQNYRRDERQDWVASVKECEENYLFLFPFLEDEARKTVQEDLNGKMGNCLTEFNNKWPAQRKALITSVRQFISFGADPTQPNNEGKIPLQVFLSQPVSEHMVRNNYGKFYIAEELLEQMVELLLTQQPEKQLAHTDLEGNTILHASSAALVMDILQAKGACHHTLNHNGESPLITFAKQNHDLPTADKNYFYGSSLFSNLFRVLLQQSNAKTISAQIETLTSDSQLTAQHPYIVSIYKKWCANNTLLLQKNMTIGGSYILTKPISVALAQAIRPEIPESHYLHQVLAERKSSSNPNDEIPVEKYFLERMKDID